MSRSALYWTLLSAAISCTCLSANTAHAQSSSLFGGSGSSMGGRATTAGASSLGNSFSSAFGSGSSTAGRSGSTSGFGSTTGGFGGTTGFGGTGGSAGRGGTTGFGSTAGTGSNASGFVGRADNAGRFVGEQRVSQTGANGRNNLRTFNPSNNAGDTNNQAGNTTTPLSRFRPTQRVAFEYEPRPAAVVQSRVQARLDHIPARLAPHYRGNVDVKFEGTAAVLTGTVEREEQIKLLEQMLRLEPAVETIRNELTVAPPVQPESTVTTP